MSSLEARRVARDWVLVALLIVVLTQLVAAFQPGLDIPWQAQRATAPRRAPPHEPQSQP